MKNRFRIRRATVRDLDILVRHRRGMWADMGVGTKRELDEADRIYKKWARQRLKTGRLVAWLAENNDGAVIGSGCIWMQPTQSRPGANRAIQPYLLSMYTEPAFRGKGVASKIVDEAVKWSKKSSFSRILLHASEKGRSLYANKGFKRTWEMKLDL